MPMIVFPDGATGAVVGAATGAVVGAATGAVVGAATGAVVGAATGAGVGVWHAAKIIDKTAMIVTIISERFILRFITFLLDKVI